VLNKKRSAIGVCDRGISCGCSSSLSMERLEGEGEGECWITSFLASSESSPTQESPKIEDESIARSRIGAVLGVVNSGVSVLLDTSDEALEPLERLLDKLGTESLRNTEGNEGFDNRGDLSKLGLDRESERRDRSDEGVAGVTGKGTVGALVGNFSSSSILSLPSVGARAVE